MKPLLALVRPLVTLLSRWAPVWLPAVLCAQIALRGLAPANAEASRLARDEARMAERVQAELDRRAALERDRAKLDDPIYRERVRRSLRVSGAAPLSLDRTYVGTLAPR